MVYNAAICTSHAINRYLGLFELCRSTCDKILLTLLMKRKFVQVPHAKKWVQDVELLVALTAW